MTKKHKYIRLPIYSIASYKGYVYFSGGGGGSTGIPNQIHIYKGTGMKEPIKTIVTGHQIFENMSVHVGKNMMICSANEFVIGFAIEDNGETLTEKWKMLVDTSLKDPTINTICFDTQGLQFAVGGDDRFVRFFQNLSQPTPLWQYEQHTSRVRLIDNNEGQLYVSTDERLAIVSNITSKTIVRKIYNDQFQPADTMLQSAYFQYKSDKLIFCHYLMRDSTYITKEQKCGRFFTMKLCKDQSCLTSKESNYMGVGCGKGETFIVDVESMECVGRQQGHESVITGALMTRGKRFITGTSECSYLVQEVNGPTPNWLIAIVLTVLCLLLFALLPSIQGQL